MRIGIQLPSFSFGGAVSDIGPTFARLVREAEPAGLDSLWVMDHFFQIRSVGAAEEPMLEGWSTLAFAAALTERITLGTMVTGVHYRHPGVLVKTATTLDVLSGGRAWLGIGAGWNERESRGLGVPFPPLGERFDRLEEQLAVITGLWSTPPGETFDFAATHYPVHANPGLVAPAQPGGVPIIVGGGGKRRTPTLAARYAADFNAGFQSVDDTGRLFQQVDDVCRELGRDPSTLVHSAAQVVCIGRDDATVRRRAAAIGREVDELIENGIAGSVEQARERLGRLEEVGTTRVYLQVLDLSDLDHLADVYEALAGPA